MIVHRVDVADAAAHRYLVTLTVPAPGADCTLSLPVWIPGSYMVREFGRHLGPLEARQGRSVRPVRKLDKSRWHVRCEGKAALTVRFEVYAYDNSVRCAWLDDSRGFFNPTSLCLQVQGREDQPQQLHLGTLPAGWDVAVALPAAPGGARRWQAADYDELADSPVELGPFWRGEFSVGGVAHEFVVAGAWPSFDGERLLADTRRICATQIQFWHGRRKPPFTRYLFLLNAVEDGYGGLEHRASTALIAHRRDLPRQGQAEASEGYQTLLGLISHEYFHTWNVKRLKPAAFLRYDYSRENYTELLWFFEGFTSYYDDLLLRRAGLLSAEQYLKLLARPLNAVAATPGQLHHSVAEASFDAWVKYYRPDENSPNATISYYTKGSLIALLLDLRLRGGGCGNLDDVMRTLWQRHQASGLCKADVLQAVTEQGGAALAEDLAGWVHGRSPLPLTPALQALGIHVADEATGWAASLGLKLAESPLTGVQVKAVLRDSAAERAGVSVGDELLALDGWRLRKFDDARQWLSAGQACELTVVRGQRLRSLTLRLPKADANPLAQQCKLSLQTGVDDATRALRSAWLGD